MWKNKEGQANDQKVDWPNANTSSEVKLFSIYISITPPFLKQQKSDQKTTYYKEQSNTKPASMLYNRNFINTGNSKGMFGLFEMVKNDQ